MPDQKSRFDSFALLQECGNCDLLLWIRLTGKTRSIWSAEWDKKYSDSVILDLLAERVKAKCETGVSDSSLKKSKRTGL